jgi:hypothetical protein
MQLIAAKFDYRDGATRYSDCARDIAVAFYTYPDAEFDQSCVASLNPAWVMPEDDLPELPLPDILGDF